MKQLRLVLLSLWVLAACNAGGDGGGMVVDGVWGRVSPAAAQNSAFYMTITNNTSEDDALTAVRTAACGTTELHESFMQEEGVMGMRPVADGMIAIPAGETAELQVGGLHVMCLDVAAPFEAGERIPLTLVFEKAGKMEVEVEIREDAP